MAATCRECGAFLDGRKMLCQRCGQWTPNGADGTVGEAVKEDDFVDAMDVDPVTVQRIVTGGPWDEAWGGGFVPTSITLLGGAPGAGKMLCLDTPLPTPTGWVRMGDVRPGDTLFDERGERCSIVQVHPIIRSTNSFEVLFSDGDRIVADSDHLWATWTRAERSAAFKSTDEFRAKRRASRPSRSQGIRQRSREYNPNLARWTANISRNGSIRTTKQIAESIWVENGKRSNHSVVRTGPLVLPIADLPISPYTLGVWLGDGSTAAGNYTKNDPELAERIRLDGYEVTGHDYGAWRWTIHGLQPQLRALGLLGNKHIPDVYLRASLDQRIELFRGLMDTDGECEKNGHCGFSTSLESIRDGFAELLATLGIKGSWSEREAKLNGKSYGPCWRFSFCTGIQAFTLSRKGQRQLSPTRGTDQRRYITNVRPVPSVAMRCIVVDSPSHLYLAGRGMVPTHNSTLLLQLSVRLAEITNKPTYYISAEQDKGELMLTLRRLNLPLERGQLRLLKKFGAGGSIDEHTLDKTPPGMIILDSVSALCGNDKHTQIAVAKRYKQYAVKYTAPTFLIAHMTKESDFAGLMALQHEVDTLATLFPEDDGMRHLKLWKHRFGPTHAEFKLLMTEHGLVAAPVKEKKGKKGSRSFEGFDPRTPTLGMTPLADPIPAPLSSNLPAAPTAAPKEILVEGQRLVRRPKAGQAREDRAAAIEGEALKKRRAPMPKKKMAGAPAKSPAKSPTKSSVKGSTRRPAKSSSKSSPKPSAKLPSKPSRRPSREARP